MVNEQSREETSTGQGEWVGGYYCKKCDETFVSLVGFDTHIEVTRVGPERVRTTRHLDLDEYDVVGLRLTDRKKWDGLSWEVVE